MQILCRLCKVLYMLEYLCSESNNFTTLMSLKAEQSLIEAACLFP